MASRMRSQRQAGIPRGQAGSGSAGYSAAGSRRSGWCAGRLLGLQPPGPPSPTRTGHPRGRRRRPSSTDGHRLDSGRSHRHQLGVEVLRQRVDEGRWAGTADGEADRTTGRSGLARVVGAKGDAGGRHRDGTRVQIAVDPQGDMDRPVLTRDLAELARAVERVDDPHPVRPSRRRSSALSSLRTPSPGASSPSRLTSRSWDSESPAALVLRGPWQARGAGGSPAVAHPPRLRAGEPPRGRSSWSRTLAYRSGYGVPLRGEPGRGWWGHGPFELSTPRTP